MNHKDPGLCSFSLGANSAGPPAHPQRYQPGPNEIWPEAPDPAPVFPGTPALKGPRRLARDPAPKSGHFSRQIKEREGLKGKGRVRSPEEGSRGNL